MTDVSNSPSRKQGLVIGLRGFEKISAVEGIRLAAESRAMFSEFDAAEVPDDARRAAIRAKHAKAR